MSGTIAFRNVTFVCTLRVLNMVFPEGSSILALACSCGNLGRVSDTVPLYF